MDVGCAKVVIALPGRLAFACVSDEVAFAATPMAAACRCYSVDRELLYEPFYADFGPLNLGKAHRFVLRTAELLQECAADGRQLLLVAGPSPHAHANAAVLLGMYLVLATGATGVAAYAPLATLEPFTPFRDPSSGPSTFHLSVADVVAGVARARDAGFLDDWTAPNSAFDAAEYDHYEAVENGDLNWIVPGKFLAFSGPQPAPRVIYGYRAHVPEDYHAYFRARGVAAVVRLNRPLYDGRRFGDAGFRMHELYFPDGSCPPPALAARFLELAEAEPGALAVHCKAGLGRTGVLICSYLIKHHGFTAAEAIGYIRVVRPGSVIGLQQNYLLAREAELVAAGAAARAAKGWRAVSLVADGTRGAARAPAPPATPPRGVAPAPPASTPPSAGSRLSALLRGRLGRAASGKLTSPAVGPDAPSAPSPGGTARMLAPNGQPRKVPSAVLAGGGLAAYAADEEAPADGRRGVWVIGANDGV